MTLPKATKAAKIARTPKRWRTFTGGTPPQPCLERASFKGMRERRRVRGEASPVLDPGRSRGLILFYFERIAAGSAGIRAERPEIVGGVHRRVRAGVRIELRVLEG